jgi:hypothetical protein
MEEITNFITNYFDDQVDTKARDLPRNVFRVDQDKTTACLPPIFSQNVGYAPNEGSVRFLDHRDHRVAHAYVLSNSGLLKEYERYVTTSIYFASYWTLFFFYIMRAVNAIGSSSMRWLNGIHKFGSMKFGVNMRTSFNIGLKIM